MGGTSTPGVTISAADSSTDPRSPRRTLETAETEVEQGTSFERRSTRQVVRPARLQDYSEEEEEEEKRRGKKGKKRKSRSLRRDEDEREEDVEVRRRDVMFSPKAKRIKGNNVNYIDETEEEEEEALSLRK